jgi:threonine-phosphate decarboxylase
MITKIEAVPIHGGQLREVSERFNIPVSQLIDFSANINPDGPPPESYQLCGRASKTCRC